MGKPIPRCPLCRQIVTSIQDRNRVMFMPAYVGDPDHRTTVVATFHNKCWDVVESAIWKIGGSFEDIEGESNGTESPASSSA